MSSIKTTLIDGDLSVGRNVSAGGDLLVQGSTHLKGKVKIDGWLEAPNLIGPGKGLFTSIEKLESAYPDPTDGWWAIVGTSLPGPIYVATGGQWQATGDVGGNPSVNPDDANEMAAEALNMSYTAKEKATEAAATATEALTAATRVVSWTELDGLRGLGDHGVWRVVIDTTDTVGLLAVHGDGMGHTVNQWLLTVWTIEDGAPVSHRHGDYRLWCRHYLSSGTSSETTVGSWSAWVLYERRVAEEVASLRTLVESLSGTCDGAATLSWKDSVVELQGVVSDVTVVEGSCVGGVAVYAEDVGRIVYLLGGTYYSGMSGNTAWVDSSGNAHASKLYRAGGELWIATGSGSQLQRLVYPDARSLWLLGDDGNPTSFKAEANRRVLATLSAMEPGAAVKLLGVDAEGTVDGVWMGDGTVDVLMHGFTRRYTFDADGLSSWQDLPTASEGTAGGWIEVK